MTATGVVLDPTLRVELYYPEDRTPERQELAERRFERLLEAHEAGVDILAGSRLTVPHPDPVRVR